MTKRALFSALVPEFQERVAQEVAHAALGVDGAPALDQLVFTRAVLDEAMRLYPPAYVIVRTGTVNLGGAWRGGPKRVGGRHDIRHQVPLCRLSLSR